MRRQRRKRTLEMLEDRRVLATIAFDLVGSASQNLSSFVNMAPAFSDPEDSFQISQRGVSATISTALLDDSASMSPGDQQGIVNESNTDAFFGAADTVNSNNPSGAVTAIWTFDVAGASNLGVSIAMGAMGDFEATNDSFTWTYRFDGGASKTAFASTINESISHDYVMSGGATVTLDDPAFVNGTVLTNDLTTFSAPLAGSGSVLELTLTVNMDGADEAFAFQDIVISGSPAGTGVTITETGGSTNVVEGAATDTFSIQLVSVPLNDVDFVITPDGQTDLGDGPGVAIMRTFTNTTPQTITVTAADDTVIEGAHTSEIRFATTSLDSNYDRLFIPAVTAQVTDNDSPAMSLVINEILADPPSGDDVNNDGNASTTQDEFVELANLSSTSLDISGWMLSDAVQPRHVFPAGTVVNPGQAVVVFSGGTPMGTFGGALVTTASTGLLGLSNTSDTVTLANAGGVVIDQVAYGPLGDINNSLTRNPDRTGGFVQHLTVPNMPPLPYSPGFENDGTTPLTGPGIPGVTVIESGTTEVSEDGATDTFDFQLNTSPTASVDVTLTPDAQLDLGMGGGVPLTFTVSDTSLQTVTVRAVDDADVEANPHTGMITITTSSTDGDYDGLTIPSISASITDNDFAGVTVTESNGSTDVVEGGAMDSFTVQLDTIPTAAVDVEVTPDSQTDLGNGPGNPVTLTFTNTSSETVNVTATDDSDVEGSHTGIISFTTSSLDGNYDGLNIPNVVVDITDNDIPGITVTESAGSTDVTEGGVSDSFDLQLNTIPGSTVTVTLSPDSQVDLGNGAGMPVDLLLSDTTVSTVVVTAVDDSDVEGSHTGTIAISTSSGDGNYDTLTVSPITANITDNDVPGVMVLESGGSTDVAEGGVTDTTTVQLNTTPASTVEVILTPDAQIDLGAGAGTPVTLIFDSTALQTVTVTAVDDVIVEGSHTGTIGITTSSADGDYHGLTVPSIAVNITDNDATPKLTLNVVASAISENGGSSSATVTRNGATTGDLTVMLASSDTGEAIVPPSVTILDGQTTASFVVTAVDDVLIDATQIVTITGSATGFEDGTDAISILDDEITAPVFVFNGTLYAIGTSGSDRIIFSAILHGGVRVRYNDVFYEFSNVSNNHIEVIEGAGQD